MALNQSPDTGLVATRSVETNKLIVRQPAKLAELSKLLETFDNLNARVGERTGGPAQDWSSGGGGGQAGAGQGDDGVSPRDKAIAAIPSPMIVKERLEKHIEKEIQKLEREAQAAATSHKPGAAFKLNEIYAKIRKMNSLLAHILEAAEDLLKRLFIRVFIDKQPIL